MPQKPQVITGTSTGAGEQAPYASQGQVNLPNDGQVSPIDLSSGLTPKAGMDLSAGMVAKHQSSIPPTTLQNLASGAGQGLSDLWSGLKSIPSAIAHPLSTASGIYDQQKGLLQRAGDDFQKGDYGSMAWHAADAAVPLLGPYDAALTDEYNNGAKTAAMTRGIVGELLPAAGPSLLGKTGELMKRGIRGDIDAPMAGRNGLTPRQQYESAKRVGVTLDAADATGSPVLQGAKAVNENSLLGSHVYEAKRTANTGALRDTTNQTLETLSPLSTEAGGNLIQSDLLANQRGLHDTANQSFQNLARQTGSTPVEAAKVPAAAARQMLDQQEPYTGMFPSLEPRQTSRILSDIGSVGETPKAGPPAPTGLLNEFGRPMLKDLVPQPAKLPNWGQLQQLRSDLQDATRNNPDLVKNRAGGQLQQMTGLVDQAMTDASGSLTPQQMNTFRDANAGWRDMKETYDDPQSPLYHAVRMQAPSKLASGIGQKTPETLRDLKSRVSPESVGVLQRGTLENALGTTASGDYNFKTFPRALNQIPDAYSQELYGPHLRNLTDLANTSQALTRDLNPSGTAKLGQKITEGSALAASPFHPLGLAPLLQYPLARAINSAPLTNWLMKEPPPLSGLRDLVPRTAARSSLMLPRTTEEKSNARR